jgi:nicotinamidase-related amidase
MTLGGRTTKPRSGDRVSRIEEHQMTSPARVPFTRDNTAVLLIDHQVGLMTGVRDIEVNELKHNVIGLARAAQLLELPIVAVTTARDSMWGPTIPELARVLGDSEILDRSTVNAWDCDRFVTRVRETGRDHLVIAGLSFEVCASLPAISARENGFHPVVVLDACGTFTKHKRQAGLARLATLGIEVSDYATMMVEIMADNADPKANEIYAAMDMPFATLMGQVAAARTQ